LNERNEKESEMLENWSDFTDQFSVVKIVENPDQKDVPKFQDTTGHLTGKTDCVSSVSLFDNRLLQDFFSNVVVD
jgi:hypothetical protein